MAGSDFLLKKIREKFHVKAYNGVRVKTKSGEIGIIKGAKGNSLKIYFEGKKYPEYCDPDKVAYFGFTLK